MKYLLDTDIIIFWLKGDKAVERKILSVGLTNISLSTISKAELYFGAYISLNIEANLNNVHKLSQTVVLINFDDAASRYFGKIKANLKRSGNLLPDVDIMIASIALTNELTLVTNNLKHFTRVENSSIENWVAPK